MQFQIRPGRTEDVPAIEELLQPYVERRILLGKERVTLYEAIQEFVVAESEHGQLIGCGALHVMWEDLGEIRTLAVAESQLRHGIGHAIVKTLEARAIELGLERLFCLTFETEFFARHGYFEIGERVVDDSVYAQLARSRDDGIAEFLDLAHVKPNTLGNVRLLKLL